MTGPAAPPPVTITELFEAVAAKAKDSVALVAPDATLTYGELNTRANQVAHRLRELGVGRHANVALCMERSANSIVALLGVLKAGAAYVPLNFEHPAARLAHQLAETEAPVLLTETSVSDRLPDFDGTVLHVDGDAALLEALPDGAPERENEPEDVVYVMYTSGSTGTPKGVGVTHRNLVTYATAILERLELDDLAGVGFAAVSALSTDLGNTSIFASLLGGGTLHLVSPADSIDGARFAAYLSSNRSTSSRSRLPTSARCSPQPRLGARAPEALARARWRGADLAARRPAPRRRTLLPDPQSLRTDGDDGRHLHVRGRNCSHA